MVSRIAFQKVALLPDYDVIVVGAGPGGSTAARTCAHEGLRVAMLERHPEPGHKLCGGGLTSKVLKEFDIDRNVIECSVKKSHIFGEKKSITLKLVEEEATVYRSRFDNYLARQAVDNGSELLTSTFSKGVLREDGKIVGVVAESPEGFVKIRGKVIIAADGFDSITARSAGLLPRYDPSDVALTVQREAWTEREVHDDAVYVFVGKNVSPCGYGWIYPKSRKS
jgi:geranylgeranyl reductase family protein